jgi:DNA polymerase III subunit alpha
MQCYEEAMDEAQRKQKEISSSQSNFFDEFDTGSAAKNNGKGINGFKIQDVPEWEHKELLALEKETLGFYITGHPLSRFAERLHLVTNADSSNLSNKHDKETVTIAGVVSNINERPTRRKDIMCYITLEDLQGSINVIFFGDVYKKYYSVLHDDDPIVIKGTIDIGDESPKVIAQEAIPLATSLENPYKQIRFMVDADKISPENIISFCNAMKKYHGKYDSFIHIINGKSETIVYLGDQLRLDINEKLTREADSILGQGATTFC